MSDGSSQSIEAEALKRALQETINLCTVLPAAWAYKGAQEFVLKHGYPFTPQTMPPKYRRMAGEIGRCYPNSLRLAQAKGPSTWRDSPPLGACRVSMLGAPSPAASWPSIPLGARRWRLPLTWVSSSTSPLSAGTLKSRDFPFLTTLQVIPQ
jgi:hypothetical protein